MTMRAYGADPSQVVDLYPAHGTRVGQAVVFHGGFWRAAYARDLMANVSADLAAAGWTTWNAEYRRVGGGGGWPGSFDDVTAAVVLAATEAQPGEPLALIGHSAGGQLALWAAARCPRVTHAVSQAGVVDLARAAALGLSRNAADELVGARRELFAELSPIDLVPLGCPQLLVHGADDDVVPPELSRRYERAAGAAGDDVTLAEIPRCGHFEHLDPTSRAWRAVREWLAHA
jgi:acetyl esterase/lipase